MNKIKIIAAVVLASISLVACVSEKSQVKDESSFTEGWIDNDTYVVRVVGVAPENMNAGQRYLLAEKDALDQADFRIIQDFHRIRYNNSYTGNRTQNYNSLLKEFADIKRGVLFKRWDGDNNKYFLVIQVARKGLKKRVLDGARTPD